MSNIYAANAHALQRSGLGSPLPLPKGAKFPPPAHYTGRGAPHLSGADVQTFAEEHPDANIALRLGASVVGIDMDAYRGKVGDETLAKAEALWGDLPPTWRTTSRGAENPSGIRYFSIAAGLELVSDLREVGPDVDVIQQSHRYAVVPPSVHPEGGTYQCFGPDGRPADMPALADLPELPQRWQEGLAKKVPTTTATTAAPKDAALIAKHRHYADAAIAAILAEVTALGDADSKDLWNQTVYDCTCAGFELANSPWVSQSPEDLTAQLMVAAPRDAGFTDAVVWRTIQSARGKIEDKARPAPGEREPDFMDDESFMRVDPNVRKAPLARPESSLLTSKSDTAQTSVSDPPASWKPQDLDSILSGTYCAPEATLFTRADGVSLMYAGLIHSFHGESESGKSLVLQIETAKLLRKGRDVLFMDFESDAASVVQRLIEFGAPRDAIRDHLYYVKPEVSPRASAAELTAWASLLQRRYALAVIDGVTDSLGIFECSTKDNDDISRWMRVLPKRVADQTGAAVALIDHVTKDSDGRGRFAIGGQAKMAGLTGAAYTVEVIEPLGRGLRGVVSLRIGKDRPGSIRPHCGTFRKGDRTQEAAHVVIDSTGSNPVVKIFSPVGRPGEAEKVKETRLADLMEKISREIEIHAGCSQAAIYKAVPGNEADKADALRKLVEAGSVTVTGGPRNSHLHTSVRPYRKDSTDRLQEIGDGQ